jgi:probable HAF family extracellular repeat protein
VADFPGDQIHDAFLWKNGVMTDLGNLGLTSYAFGVNNRGQVVGHSHLDEVTTHAFLWEKGGPMIDLNTRIPPGSGVQLTDAVTVNDRGEIAAFGLLSNGDQRAFLLIPCDGDNADGEDCQNGDEGEAAVTQSHPSPARQASTAASPSNLTPKRLAAIRARLGGRFPYRGLGR